MQLMTHETILERKERLKERSLGEYLALKARRYAFFRMQNFLGGGSAPDVDHIETIKEIEEQVKPLGGFAKFADSWDIDPLTGKIIKRDRSVWVAHEEYMRKAAIPLQMRVTKDGG